VVYGAYSPTLVSEGILTQYRVLMDLSKRVKVMLSGRVSWHMPDACTIWIWMKTSYGRALRRYFVVGLTPPYLSTGYQDRPVSFPM
jgi:hypothetical protein